MNSKIECKRNGCTAEAKGRGLCTKHYQRWLHSPEAANKVLMRAKKEDIEYSAAHHRLNRLHGRASANTCVDCGNAANDWSLKHDATERLVCTRGAKAGSVYSTNPDDYQARCKACHRAYDSKHFAKRPLPENIENTFKPETQAQAEEAVALLKSGMSATAAAAKLGLAVSTVTRYFLILEGQPFREWKKSQAVAA